VIPEEKMLASRNNRKFLNITKSNKEDIYRQVKSLWLKGAWEMLIDFDKQEINNHQNRDSIYLFISDAMLHLGMHEKSQNLVKQCLSSGCSVAHATKILISGLHNTLARIFLLKKDIEKSKKYFKSALEITGTYSTEFCVDRRANIEATSLGLLPESAEFIEKNLSKITDDYYNPSEQKAMFKILKSEIELLQHELSISIRRNQLYKKKLSHHGDANLDKAESWTEQLRRKSCSQLGQDLWVLDRTNYKRDGFFVEFGASDGIVLSNTYLLEKEFNWKGVCAEPNPEYYALLKDNRNCSVSDCCIDAFTGKEVDFVLAKEYGSILKYINSDDHADIRNAYLTTNGSIKKSTVSLDDFLISNNAPRKIDYLSIDTEGNEYAILKEFPFEMWDIKYITVEHNYTKQRELICALLSSKGYHRKTQLHDDWYFK
jgi:FkbM family methyltransferase